MGRSIAAAVPQGAALCRPPVHLCLRFLFPEIEVEVPVEHGLLVENLLDLAHAPFTHTTTFARGWPVRVPHRLHAAPACTPAGRALLHCAGYLS